MAGPPTDSNGTAVLTADFLSDARIAHGFFDRAGGISEGVYASLNCGLGSGDDAGRVYENRRRALRRLDGAASVLVTARQVHSSRVTVVDRPWPDTQRPEADGLVTRTSGLALGVLTADCAPVLLADPGAGIVAAAHAGWRGAKDGILARTVEAMERLGARRGAVVAAIGPCIGQDSYEVGAEFQAVFVADDPTTVTFFRPADRARHFMFDLAGFVARELDRVGVGSVAVLGHDTYADESRFFSFRRATHAGGGDYGRHLSAIALVP
jgi:purine-nucleoside/S-methyl-5'-thioadenosine phosphorylase / adenosine deaminase